MSAKGQKRDIKSKALSGTKKKIPNAASRPSLTLVVVVFVTDHLRIVPSAIRGMMHPAR